MAITVECIECGYITDLEETSETNPRHCPKCAGELWICGTETNIKDYLRGA